MSLLRIVRTVGMSIFLGGLTSVAVAWALAAFLPQRNFGEHVSSEYPPGVHSFGEADRLVMIEEFSRGGMVRRQWWIQPLTATTNLGPRFQVMSPYRTRVTGRRHADRDWGLLPATLRNGVGPPSSAIEDARGWPCLALWCEVPEDSVSQNRLWARGGVSLSDCNAGIADFRALPCLPIWNGLLIDTGIYASPWLFVLSALPIVAASRRDHRLNRGRCPTCGYDLRRDLLSGCPECGWNRCPGDNTANAGHGSPVRVRGLRWWSKWAGAISVVAAAVAFVGSVFVMARFESTTHCWAQLAYGRLAVGYSRYRRPRGCSVRWVAEWRHVEWSWQMGQFGSAGWDIFVPLWLPCAFLALPTGWLWLRDGRVLPPCCARCGYDLTGTTNGCPECGWNRARVTP